MADVDYDDDDGYDVRPQDDYADHSGYVMQPRRFRLSRLVNIGAAIASVGFVIWLALWGYGEAVREARGVPVIKAEAGPWRIAPADPGGSVAENQGLAVNDVAAIGTAAPPPERLMLAPRAIELTDEDAAGLTSLNPAPAAPADPLASAAPMAAPLSAPTAAPTPAPEATIPPSPPATDVTVAEPAVDPVAAALAEALGNTAEDPAADAALAAPAPDDAATDALRPKSRPAELATGTDPLTAGADGALPPVTEIDPATLAEGTRLTQMGAYDSAEEARAEWVKIANRYADLMQGKSMVVQSAQSGGRTFFRLRAAGFQGEEDSRDFCAKIVERGGSCIPVIHR